MSTYQNETIENSEVIDNLNDLVVKNYDASEGYKKAAENVENNNLKEVFSQEAMQRKDFAGKLQTEVRQLGGQPKSESSALGGAHRTWMDVKTAFATNEEQAIIEACETGEKAAVEEYDEMLDQNIPNNIQNIIQQQRNQINNTLQQIKSANR